jgi:hypothetical protein
MVRYDFGAIAEVVDLDSGEDVIVITRDLSLSGCFVKTNLPFPARTDVRVRITYAGLDFAATGVVVFNARDGMGIQFAEVRPNDRALLLEWLHVAEKKMLYPNSPASTPQNRVVQIKNRLNRPSHQPCIPAPAALATKPKTSRRRPIIDELLASARRFFTFGEDGLG